LATVLTATFADSVQAIPNQKFSILGGGIKRLTPPSLPATFTRLDILLIMEFAAGERELTFSAVLRTPSGKHLADFNGTISRQKFDEVETSFIGIPLPPINFEEAGQHILDVASGESRKEFGLVVERPKVVRMPAVEQKRPN
jgi:hypothetical protein